MNAISPRLSPERQIQRTLFAKLTEALPLGSAVIHVPNEDATGSAAYGQQKIRDGMLPGCPDLLILVHGRAYWLEVKAPNGRVSDAQRRAHPRLRAAGSPVEVVYSVEDGLAAVREWGLLPHPPTPAMRSETR
ncbi:VRR-NUC domain-containing protein [Roseomonas mucosa]|uniref:VRR-NUC domain-containing protein n=1 Tax=Roseomonas mucosa TaxID=207340 RepID=UPI0030CB0BB3